MVVMSAIVNRHEPLIVGTIVTPPNANSYIEFADAGTL
jgi:hypothetical protein